MNRETKFRGFTKYGKCRVGLLFFNDKIVTKTMSSTPKDVLKGIETKYEYIEVLPETIGQYTGLTDTNKVEIYEGDIVERTGHKYIVNYYQGGFHLTKFKGEIEIDFELQGMFRGNFLAFYAPDITVIGNIHTKEGLS